MTSHAAQAAAAATLLWLGMVLAISFLEAPLKFRAPGLELRVGLAVGRIVFRALNAVELVWAAVIVTALVFLTPAPSPTVAVTAGLAVVLLAVQLSAVRPRLNRRSNRVLAGEEAPRSAGHHAYIVLEVCKVIALIVLGARLLTG